MREALAALTLRGRAFLAAGVTAVVCAVVLGQEPLVRAGLLVLGLPLLTAAVLARSRYRLSLEREVSPQRVCAGRSAVVRLTLRNQGRLPSGPLLLEDRLPYALGTRPRFVLDGVGREWRRSVDYPVRPEVRGRYEIGPMTVRLRDPFGMVELTRSFRGTVPLMVTPRTVPLPVVPIQAGRHGSGDSRARASVMGSAEDVTVRDYRRGDELRRVHWRSSARRGELMVRREEHPWQARATVVIDNRTWAHHGHGDASTLERAVSAAASVAVHLAGRGYDVGLVTAAGEECARATSGAATGPLLDALALLRADPSPTLEAGPSRTHEGGLVVGVFGALGPDDVAAARRLARGAGTALALVLDPAQRSGGEPPPGASARAAAMLTGQGWRTATVAADDPLGAVWERLARRAPGPAEAVR